MTPKAACFATTSVTAQFSGIRGQFIQTNAADVRFLLLQYRRCRTRRGGGGRGGGTRGVRFLFAHGLWQLRSIDRPCLNGGGCVLRWGDVEVIGRLRIYWLPQIQRGFGRDFGLQLKWLLSTVQ